MTMQIGLVLVAALAIVHKAHAQCACTRSAVGAEISVLRETSPGSGQCETVVKSTGGCYCDLEGLDECEVVTATKFEYTEGSSCEAVEHQHAVCSDDVFVVETEPCVIDQRVAWTKDCAIERSLFPQNAVISRVVAFITQTDNFTFSGVGASAGGNYVLRYQTNNEYLPRNVFGQWPDTDLRESSGRVPSDLTVSYFGEADMGTLRLVGTAAANSWLMDAFSANNDALFRFSTELSTFTSGFSNYEYFPNFSYLKVVFRVTFSIA
mmetsp:Transcript_4382/g.11986  ORF Transcript_4382/g.11986 Transcript_4382/m.11986 type:complete len:265 (-) Transcript_4382:1659-2453(-)